MEAIEYPKLFISYSWSSPEHELWVLNLATELRENGVDVILDKWDLKEGHDAYAFMEKMVTDPEIKKVAIVCDRVYMQKADERKGGVGVETQIISSEVYNKVDQSKFVVVVSERDENGNVCLPSYYKSRIYIDLGNSDLYAKNFEQLLRWIYDKPLYIKPDIGKTPTFLSDSQAISLGTTTRFSRALDSVRTNREYAKGALNEYFDTFVENLERFRIKGQEGDFDDKVMESIEQFIPYRNEVIQLFLALTQYRDNPETHQLLYRFFERLIPFLDRPPNVTTWGEWDFDNFKFIIQELFLYYMASLLKYECFSGVAFMLDQRYYIEENPRTGSSSMVRFTIFRSHLNSLEHRNKRLQLRRLSLQADLLKQRSAATGFNFRQLMQADFFLYLRDCLDCIRSQERQRWWPDTLVYLNFREDPFEVFARAGSTQYFNRLKLALGINVKQELDPLIQAFKDQKLYIPRWEFESFNPFELLNYEHLATRP